MTHAMKYIYIFTLTLFVVTCTIQTQKNKTEAGQLPDKLDSFRHELSAGRGQLDSMRVRLNAEIVRLKMSVSADKCAGQTDTLQTKNADIKPDSIPDVKTDSMPDIFNRQPDCHNIQ